MIALIVVPYRDSDLGNQLSDHSIVSNTVRLPASRSLVFTPPPFCL